MITSATLDFCIDRAKYYVDSPVGRVVVAAVAARVLIGLGRIVERKAGGHIGTLLDKVIPLNVQRTMTNAITAIRRPYSKFMRFGHSLIGATHYSNFCAPIVEEVLFRGILQRGSLAVLTRAGMNERWAKFLSISVSTFCFSLFHGEYVSHPSFQPLLISSTTYGLVDLQYGARNHMDLRYNLGYVIGLIYPIATHILNNLLVR